MKFLIAIATEIGYTSIFAAPKKTKRFILNKLVEGKNCFIAELYQTEDLIGAYGEDAYLTKVLKRITCRN